MRATTQAVLALTMSLSSSAFAGKVLPEFYFWYSGKTAILGVDSCGIPSRQYTKTSGGKDDIINKTFQFPARITCTWSQPKLVEKSNALPDDFPVNRTDYQTILASDTAARVEHWRADCVGKNGEVQESINETIQPSYVCPVGSRASFDKASNGVACTTTPKVCIADIVGRDLNVPGMGNLGHVGMTTSNLDDDSGNAVLETLNDKAVINTNTLASFQHAVEGKFWGAKFGVSRYFVSLDQAKRVIQTGEDQKKFDPEYTFTIFWQAGGYNAMLVYDAAKNALTKTRAFKRAKFRCDTFVNYSYNYTLGLGMGQALPTNSIFLPANTYNSLTSRRLDMPLEANFLRTTLTNKLMQPITQQHITKLDTAVMAYLNNTRINRNEKLTFLVQQLPMLDEHNYAYVMDTLAGLKSHEKVNELISLYETEKNEQKKSKLISTMVTSVALDNKTQQQSINKEEIVRVQQVIIKTLKEENNPLVLNQAIDQSFSVLPITMSHYELIANAMERLQQLDANKMTLARKYVLLVSMAFANDEMQASVLPKLLSSTYSSRDKAALQKAFVFIASQLTADDILQQNKAKIKAFIRTTTHAVVEEDIESLMQGSAHKVRRDIAQTILAIKNPYAKAQRLNTVSQGVIATLTATERKALLEQFNDALKTIPSDKERLTLFLSISKLMDSQRLSS